MSVLQAKRLATAAALACAAAGGRAAEIEPGVPYPGGTRVEASEAGVAFTIPEGWTGMLPAGTEVFLMRSDANPNLNVLVMAEEASADDLAAVMAGRIDLGGGVTLIPQGSVTREGSRLTGRYEVEGGASPLAGHAAARAGGHGISVAFLAVAPPEALAPLVELVTTLANDVELGAPATSVTTGAGTAGSQQTWQDYLRGKYIVRYYTASGYTDEEHLWLCSDGSFARRGAAGGFGGGASGAFQSDGTGRWQATGAGAEGSLVLHYGDGSTARYALAWDYEKNQLFLDGKRWLHDTNERCR